MAGALRYGQRSRIPILAFTFLGSVLGIGDAHFQDVSQSGIHLDLDDDTGLVMIMNVEFANRTSDATTRRVWYKLGSMHTFDRR